MDDETRSQIAGLIRKMRLHSDTHHFSDFPDPDEYADELEEILKHV